MNMCLVLYPQASGAESHLAGKCLSKSRGLLMVHVDVGRRSGTQATRKERAAIQAQTWMCIWSWKTRNQQDDAVPAEARLEKYYR